MQRAPSNSDQASRQRERCGRCAAYAPSPAPEKQGYGICQWTASDTKHAGTVRADQTRCVFAPSKFKVKKFGYGQG